MLSTPGKAWLEIVAGALIWLTPVILMTDGILLWPAASIAGFVSQSCAIIEQAFDCEVGEMRFDASSIEAVSQAASEAAGSVVSSLNLDTWDLTKIEPPSLSGELMKLVPDLSGISESLMKGMVGPSAVAKDFSQTFESGGVLGSVLSDMRKPTWIPHIDASAFGDLVGAESAGGPLEGLLNSFPSHMETYQALLGTTSSITEHFEIY